MRFRVRANPVRSVTTEKDKRGKIYAHVTITQKREWLLKKALTHGFRLDEERFSVVESDNLRFWRESKGRPVEIGVAVYEGELEVIDAETFLSALTQGIGRAKAYGCGLLTVARIP